MSNLASPFQYRNAWPALAPEWLTTGNAQAFMYTLQLMTDCLLEKAVEASTIRFPGIGDPSQLPYLAFDRQLVQGLLEPNASFAARLSGAFQTWKLSGSRRAVLGQIQCYLQGLQPSVSGSLPALAIVGGVKGGPVSITTWDTLTQGAALQSLPTRVTVRGGNYNWDGDTRPWRAWLVLYMALVSVGQSGSTCSVASAAAGSLYAGSGATKVYGHNVGGVWVPNTTGTAINSPWITLTGLTGLAIGNVGQWVTITGATHAGNNGTFPIVSVASATSCVIANPAGVAAVGDTGAWSIAAYPFLGPSMPWGSPGTIWGPNELQTPALDTGSNVRGVWQPTIGGSQPSGAWGLVMGNAAISPPPPVAQIIMSVRALLRQWKSAATYYESIIVAFDGGTGAAGSAYSPNSTPGAGNPDGTFGGHGKVATVGGVPTWVPNRLVSSPYDAYCQGTGQWLACGVPNVT